MCIYGLNYFNAISSFSSEVKYDLNVTPNLLSLSANFAFSVASQGIGFFLNSYFYKIDDTCNENIIWHRQGKYTCSPH